MKNIFLLYIPPNNYEALVHYQDTVRNRVAQERIFRNIDFNLKNRLRNIFDDKPIAVWGSRDSSQNRAKFDRMREGDHLLVIEHNTIKLLGSIAGKTVNEALSRELWKNLQGKTTEGWNLIYFIANPLEINLPFNEFIRLFNYSTNYQLRGFQSVSEDKLNEFYAQYDDLYSILQRIKTGEKIEKKADSMAYAEEEKNQDTSVQDEGKEYVKNEELSDHLLMQWKLLHLGIKAGSKVWIPKNDQKKITNNYQFTDFEKEFTAGIDMPAKYVENIDVIWKEEFRVDAAFEIENTTSIYSGLLRFSDLKIIAPNSNYPLFIVAPVTKRNQLVEQIKRPTFKKLEFKNKVRFLPYESIDKVYEFFGGNASGLNVNVLIGHSEMID